MKRIVFIFQILIIISTNFVISDSSSELLNRLKNVGNFSADFTNKIIDKNSKVIYCSSGKLWFKDLKSLQLYTEHPKRSLLTFEEDIIRFYDFNNNQIIVTSYEDFYVGSIIREIKSKKTCFLKRHLIQQSKDQFFLLKKRKKSSENFCSIEIQKNGRILSLQVTDNNNKLILYNFKNLSNEVKDVNDNKYRFVPDINTIIDDQRRK
ncbi:outer membrane lipoprotein chaperone LolA [Candidatus Riesia pediculischaeffi]|uniref:Outer-membrane lipoprotein carrier protein n=1 Tax=Candidatus Riesia pediculischaeffi PTSU TaxID=1401651 RepID=A0A0C1V7S6_9ENTR|nr:outer membrane lipoprotein chaperone LolA [Candidatus Riesia pediculischaeffi]KIE63883.1 Outer membrane lipoprotein carrier protein LolA [Candidatus Riesia pediculischaeffi PTSU]